MKPTRIISCFLALSCICAAFSGCAGNTQNDKESSVIAPMEKEPVYSLSFDIIGGSDVMPITGYYGPRLSTYSKNGEALPEMINDEYYQMIQECGVNVACYSPTDYEYTPEFVLKMLEFGDKYQIGHFVTDTKLSTGQFTDSEAAQRTNNYANYASFCGVHVCDEPYLEGTIDDNGKGCAPCGRCREFINCIHDENYLCQVILEDGTITTIGDLLPNRL